MLCTSIEAFHSYPLIIVLKIAPRALIAALIAALIFHPIVFIRIDARNDGAL